MSKEREIMNAVDTESQHVKKLEETLKPGVDKKMTRSTRF